MADDFNPFDPTPLATASPNLGPDSPLEDWLKDPAAAAFVRQKAFEHAQDTLGYSDATKANGQPMSDSGDNPFSFLKPQRGSIFDRTGLGTPDPTASQGPFVLNPSGVRSTGLPAPPPAPPPTTGPTPVPVAEANPLDPQPDAVPAMPSVPLPRERPPEAGPGASDISASKKKTSDAGDASNDFAKMLAGLKAIQPPPVQPVGTPSVRSPTAMQAPQISQLLQLFGAQGKPDSVSTLGRLLVSGKA